MIRYVVTSLTCSLLMMLASCTGSDLTANSNPPADEPVVSAQEEKSSQVEGMFASVTAVEVSGDSRAYTFAVTVQSPDTGCDQYANWWEVVSEDGTLLYRRILAHSHVEEQPFRRTGGPVAVSSDQLVIVRAHMDPQGYGTQAMQGSAATGFEAIALQEDFAADLATAEPQPQGCAF